MRARWNRTSLKSFDMESSCRFASLSPLRRACYSTMEALQLALAESSSGLQRPLLADLAAADLCQRSSEAALDIEKPSHDPCHHSIPFLGQVGSLHKDKLLCFVNGFHICLYVHTCGKAGYHALRPGLALVFCLCELSLQRLPLRVQPCHLSRVQLSQ